MAPSQPIDATVVVLNRDGRRHLARCLSAALALEGLAGPAAVVLADDGSSDDSVAFARSAFPGLRVVAWDAPVGFAAGNNRAVEQVTSEYVLLLNNDTVVRSDALTLLADEAAGGAALVGARIVTMDAQRIDFDGGGASFTGHGHPLGHGRPIPAGAQAPRDTLFGSGAGLLLRRAEFRRLGGFEAAFEAYYEDVDLGWRAWLAGGRVRLVPGAVVRHVGGGSARLLGSERIAGLHERNALAVVVRDYGNAALRRVLPAALALAACRAGADGRVIAAALPPEDAWPPLPRRCWSGWRWLERLDLDWPALWASREKVQALRVRPDAEVLARLAAPLAPVPPSRAMFSAVARAHVVFGLGEWFGPLPRSARARLPRAVRCLLRRWPNGTGRPFDRRGPERSP